MNVCLLPVLCASQCSCGKSEEAVVLCVCCVVAGNACRRSSEWVKRDRHVLPKQCTVLSYKSIFNDFRVQLSRPSKRLAFNTSHAANVGALLRTARSQTLINITSLLQQAHSYKQATKQNSHNLDHYFLCWERPVWFIGSSLVKKATNNTTQIRL